MDFLPFRMSSFTESSTSQEMTLGSTAVVATDSKAVGPLVKLPSELLIMTFQKLLKEAHQRSPPNFGVQTRYLGDVLNMLSINKELRTLLLPEFYGSTLFPITSTLASDDVVGHHDVGSGCVGCREGLEAIDFDSEHLFDVSFIPRVYNISQRKTDNFLLHHASQICCIRFNIISTEYASAVTARDHLYQGLGFYHEDGGERYRKFLEAQFKKAETIVKHLLGDETKGTQRTQKIREFRVLIQPLRDLEPRPVSQPLKISFQREVALLSSLIQAFEPLRNHLHSDQCAKLDWDGDFCLKNADINWGIFSRNNVSFLRHEIEELQIEDEEDRNQWAKEQQSQRLMIEERFLSKPRDTHSEEREWIQFWRDRKGLNPYSLARFNFLHPRFISESLQSDGTFSRMWFQALTQFGRWDGGSLEHQVVLELLRRRRKEHCPELDTLKLTKSRPCSCCFLK